MVRLPRRPHTKIRRTSCTSTESKLGTHVTAECLGPYWTLHKPAGLKCVASGLKTAAEWPNAASKQGWGIAAHIASQATPQLQVIEKEYVNNRTCFDAALLLKPFSHQSADANGLHSITSHAKHPSNTTVTTTYKIIMGPVKRAVSCRGCSQMQLGEWVGCCFA